MLIITFQLDKEDAPGEGKLNKVVIRYSITNGHYCRGKCKCKWSAIEPNTTLQLDVGLDIGLDIQVAVGNHYISFTR